MLGRPYSRVASVAACHGMPVTGVVPARGEYRERNAFYGCSMSGLRDFSP